MGGEIRVAILFRLDDREVFDRVVVLWLVPPRRGIVIGFVRFVVVLFEVTDLLDDDVVGWLFLVELLMLRDVLEDGLRTMGVLTERRVLVDPREELVEVGGREIVDRLGVLRLELRVEILGLELRVETLGLELRVETLGLELRVETLGLELRLDVIDLDRLGVELRVGVLGALLRLGALGATDRLGARVGVLGDVEREGVALRVLLLELLLLRELLDATTGPTNKKNKQKMEMTRKDVLFLAIF